jgi:hypothetical protein
MKLQEEYLKRHNINFPPIYHVKNATVILKLRDRPRVLLDIEWKNTATRPGYYVFNFLKPNHNGYLTGNYFTPSGDNQIYQYDHYISFLTRWTKNLKNFSPVGLDEVKITIWKMFLYCFDGWIVENYTIEESLFTPLTKADGVDNALVALKDYNSVIGEIYELEFRKFEKNYSEWLVNLIDFHAAEEYCQI